MTPQPPGDTPTLSRVYEAVNAGRFDSPSKARAFANELNDELTAALSQVETLRRDRDEVAGALAAKCEALEKLVIELTLIAISTAHIKHHHKSRLDQLLSELQYAGIESPSDGTQRLARE